jgi:DNA-binding Lrp family transcriptional regulator
MANPGLTLEQMQEAANIVEKHGGSISSAASAIGIPRETLTNRVNKARLNGIKPTVSRIEPKPYKPQRLGRVHMVIPDIQAKPDVPHEHLEWVANYAIEKRPDVIIQIGDWADMPSLSLYDKGKRCYEGRRYVKDIDAANYSLERFERTLEEYNRTHTEDPYNPRKVITYGNHENRIWRATMLDASLDGKLSMEDLHFANRGWECFDFLKIVEIDGVQYSHYFISGSMGRPVSSAAALLKARGGSATMGHVQRMDVAYHPQTQQIGLFAGVCYLHDEDYLGPQGNSCPRQILMKHEVEKGRYDLMAVSLRFLQKRYA